jgi:hypothetical protein
MAQTLLAAILPIPDLETIRATADKLQRHLREPPRRRTFQSTSMLS